MTNYTLRSAIQNSDYSHIAASAKTYFIFGGTGSLGKTLARRLLKLGRTVVVFSRDEVKHFLFRKEFSRFDGFFHNVIGDVRNSDAVYAAIQRHSPDVIIIASAMKQVPLCEDFPEEAVQTNVIGTQNILRAAEHYYKDKQCQILSVSTDKAVKPVNAYGHSKALQEAIHLTYNKSQALVANCVRYGNVLESTGSVIPFFKKLLDQGVALPITDPAMTRFILSLDEAVNLIFDALKDTEGGKIFVPKVRSCKVTQIACALSNAYGIEPYSNLYNVGIRPGEKIHEVLISEEECRRTTLEDNHYVIRQPFDEQSDGCVVSDASLFTEEQFSSGYSGNYFSFNELETFLMAKGVISCESASRAHTVS